MANAITSARRPLLRRDLHRPRVRLATLCRVGILTMLPALAFLFDFKSGSEPVSGFDGRTGAVDVAWTYRAGSAVPDLVAQYARDYAPLTRFATDLVSTLQSMDADLAEATAPLARAINNGTVLIHPIGFAIPPSYVRAVVPPKGQALATVIPGAQKTYKYMPRAGHTPAELTALEREYYADMERSLFGLTWKKAGWDCLRHLELLAAGTVPLFTDVDKAPRGAIAFLPKRVLSLMLRFPGIQVVGNAPGLPKGSGTAALVPAPVTLDMTPSAGDGTAASARDGIAASAGDGAATARCVTIGTVNIDPVTYSLTVMALLDYTRRHLTTPAMAAHLLKTMGIRPPYCRDGVPRGGHEGLGSAHRFRTYGGLRLRRARWWNDDDSAAVHSPLIAAPRQSPGCPPASTSLRVLYLTLAKDTTDYMADTLAHGLVTLLGPGSVTQHHRRDVLYTTPGLLQEGNLSRARSSQYGFGFSYGNTLFDLRDAAAVKAEAGATEASLRAAIAAREFDVVVLSLIHRGRPPLMDAVCAAYPPSRVAAVHGHDTPPTDADLEEYGPCAGYFFAREAM